LGLKVNGVKEGGKGVTIGVYLREKRVGILRIFCANLGPLSMGGKLTVVSVIVDLKGVVGGGRCQERII